MAGSEAPALELRHLTKSFPGTIALCDVDLQLRPGEVHALIGQNGSGKSTLIKVLAGFHAPDSGSEATAGGVTLRLGDSAAAKRAGIRFVHQDLGLVDSLDAVDNLALGAGYVTGVGFRIKWRQQRAAALQAIATLGHPIDVRSPVAELSAVERTMLAIARALRNPLQVRLLVLDEPTAAMPRPDVERLHEVVRRVRDSGVAVLYVSHHIDEVLSLADRVTVLRNGRRVATWEVTRADSAGLVEMMTGSAPTESAVVTQADQTSTEPALRLDDVSSNVLREFDLMVRPGEIVGVAGLNGSGRDELCSAIFGGRRRSGEVRVAGSPLPPMRPDLAVSMGMGYVPANRMVNGLIMSMTITENLTLVDLSRYGRYMRLRRAVERADVVGLVGRLGVRAPNVDASVEALSGGNQQKVVMGKWLRLEPNVLLLDEPTQGVDVAAKADLHGLITQAAAQGAAVVITSSDEDELARLCHRVVVLRRGRAVAQHCWPDIVAARITHDCLSDRACAEEGNDHDGNH